MHISASRICANIANRRSVILNYSLAWKNPCTTYREKLVSMPDFSRKIKATSVFTSCTSCAGISVASPSSELRSSVP
jgi:hypothetical protein